MKQIFQNFRFGELQILEVPEPSKRKDVLRVQTRASLVSVGTEKNMIDIAKKSIFGKAFSRPDWVKQVVDKVKTEGFTEAWRQSKARLDMPVPLGYSSAGTVLECGVQSIDVGFKVGDRIACTGSGYASHAEIVSVPPNLCAKIPDNVAFEDAAYGALGGIAMEAVRLARVEFGHRVVVIGLGLLGQLATQILVAAGCHVFGIDVKRDKCVLAEDHGAEVTATVGRDDPVQAVLDFTDGEGADSVIILAAVESNEPLEQAADICRERGKIVAGGLVGLDVPRKTFFEKELDLCVSRAWGPGALNPDYEERNVQWPLAYVRWTAQRNIEEFLKMVSLERVKLDKLTTHRFPFDKALDAYDMILKGKENVIGVILEYSQVKEIGAQRARNNVWKNNKVEVKANSKDGIGIGLIGAGLFTRGTLLPVLKGISGIQLKGVATASGMSGRHVAEKGGFQYATTEHKKILEDPQIDLVFILTRHNSHASFVIEALKAGKHVFVEKPLCINKDELTQIIHVYSSIRNPQSAMPLLMVGFNRRFSPAAKKAREFIGSNGPSSVIQIRCNAGFIPKNSWVHHPEEGGSRIIGEVCHFVDLSQYLTGGLPRIVFAACAESSQETNDNICVTLQMDNGAAVNITYASNGDKSFPREEVQIFTGGGVFIIHNFGNAEQIVNGKKKKWKSIQVDRGHKNEIKEILSALKSGKNSPIDFRSIVATTITTFAIEDSIRMGKSVEIDMDSFHS